MFISAENLASETEITTDICIIGCGAAGITLGLEFEKTNTQVVILESGSFEEIVFPDAQYDFKSTKRIVATDSRVRSVGGTTQVWAGRWKEFDFIDMEHRSWVSDFGWPISFQDIAPFYIRAEKMHSIPKLSTEYEKYNYFNTSSVFELTSFRFQKKEDHQWGKTKKDLFQKSSNIQIHTKAHVVSYEKKENRIVSVTVKTTQGGFYTVKAQTFVLATGGIENARQLLLGNIGNEYGQVGLYYMDHPKGRCGTVELYNPLDFQQYIDTLSKNKTTYVGIRLKDDVQKKEQLLNHYVILEPQQETSILHKIKRKICGPSHSNFLLTVRNFMEQIPSQENKICLDDEKDMFGLPKARVTWSLSDIEKKSLIRFHELLKKELQTLHIGELASPLLESKENDFSFITDASHHTGTTRMGMDKEKSVVDINCKIHSVENMYCIGSSVFPISGYANPTAGICALAIRLADHLKEQHI